uniref:Uncharacterized protein n=1 Tax=Arion vulgaris TaxID=1028688 RepID=A0A0B7AWL5_9EUPU
MWANPFGASWSMHQADYQNVPHENVDWAALAKQWISQRETHGPSHLVMPPPADGPSVAPPPPPPPPPPEPEPDTAQPKHAADENSMDIASDEEENGNSVVARVSEPEAVGQQFSSSGQAPWIPQQQSWWPPRQSEDLWMGPQIGSNKEGFSGDMQGFQPMSSFPPGGDIYFNQDSNNKDHYWDEHTGGGDSDSSQPPLLAEPPLRSHHQMHHHHHHHQQQQQHPHQRSLRHNQMRGDFLIDEEEGGLDAAKRRALPVWIRDGLEKMEREKQKLQEKEQLKQQREAMLKEQKGTKVKHGEDNDNPMKSKFDSDEEVDTQSEKENDEDDIDEVEIERPRSRSSSSTRDKAVQSPALIRRSPSPTAFMTEEEKEMTLMMKVKRLLTETLLEVTNEEIRAVAVEVYQRARKKVLQGRLLCTNIGRYFWIKLNILKSYRISSVFAVVSGHRLYNRDNQSILFILSKSSFDIIDYFKKTKLRDII